MKNVWFVCTGNTCRSPMAAALFSLAAQAQCLMGIEIHSAGLAAQAGAPASSHAVQAMEELGVNLRAHRAAALTPAILQADLVFCMNTAAAAALESAGVPKAKLYVPDGGVPDPYGGTLETYRACRDALASRMPAVIDRLYGCSLRQLEETDLSGAAQIESACFATPWSLQALTSSSCSGAVFFGAFDGSQMIGYCGVNPVADEGFITNIAVLPERRGAGIGSRLVARLRQFASERSLTALHLEVRAGNQAARRLYAQYGFLALGTRRGFYQFPREDAILMTWQKENT